MKSFVFLLGFVILATLPFTGEAKKSKINPHTLLKKAEKIRNPNKNYKVHVVLIDVKKGKKETRTYNTYVKSRHKTLVQFLTPVADQDTQVLMVDNQMWIYMPTVANPVRISPRQRLSGNAVYGDIARLNFHDNYKPTLARTVKTKKGQKAYVLKLTAMEGKAVTYDRIEYWIKAKDKKPIKALFKTRSGKTLRQAFYQKFKKVFGVLRPTRIVFIDYLNQKHTTTLLLKKFKKRSLPDLAFDKMNLGRSLASFQ